MAIKVTKKDAKANDVVPPGQYIVDVKGLTMAPAKSDQSTNYTYALDFVSDANGNEDCVGARIKPFLINEKGLFGTGLNFLVACGFPKEQVELIKQGKAPDAEVDEKAPVGKRIRAFISNTTYNNRVSNEATDFLPL